MMSESVIELLWAAIALAFFYDQGGFSAVMAGHTPAWVVNEISNTTLGVVGGILALLGVVVAPITSGDTAFRSARLIIADMLHYDQKPILNRLVVSIPLFVIGVGITFINFDVIWRYFAWSNQALSVITLWMITAWLMRRRSKVSFLALLPAIFMTYICSSFVFVSNQFVGLGATTQAYIYGAAMTAIISGLLMSKIRKNVKQRAAI